MLNNQHQNEKNREKNKREREKMSPLEGAVLGSERLHKQTFVFKSKFT